MMTLLVLVYKSEQKIPEQFSEFYENLFQTLLMRHDRSKPGYTRDKNCQINERKLQELFEAFCFLSSKESLTTMKFDKMHDLTNLAVEKTKIVCDAGDFIKDISKIACLVIEEGLDFHFIHKSVREYHAAVFIKRRSDEFAKKYYRSMIKDQWLNWMQELNFLSQVDEYRFTKYFTIPHIESTFNKKGLDIKKGYKKIDNLNHVENIDRYIVSLDNETHQIRRITSPGNRYFLDSVFLSDLDNFSLAIFKNQDLINKVKNDINAKKNKSGESENETFDLKMIDLIKIAGLTQLALDLLNKTTYNIFLFYKERCDFVENEENKSDMVDF